MEDSPFCLQVLHTYFFKNYVSIMANLDDYNKITDLKKHMQNLRSILKLVAQDYNGRKPSSTSSECMQSFLEDGFTESWQLSLKQSNYKLGLASVIVPSLGLPLHNFFLFFNAKFRMLHTSLYISMSTRNNYLASHLVTKAHVITNN